MSSYSPFRRWSTFRASKAAASPNRRSRRHRKNESLTDCAGGPESLERRFALTISDGFAITSDSRVAWVIALDGEETAYLNRSSFADMRVDDNSSFSSPLTSNQAFISKLSSTGSFSVDTIYVTTGNWGNNFAGPLTGTSVSFSAGATDLISGTLFGTASVFPGGGITFFHRASSLNGDLEIIYGPGYDATNGPTVAGNVNLFTGTVTLRFTKGDVPFLATASSVFTRYATFNANTNGAQRLEVREGFDFDQRLMVDLRPAGSSIIVGSPWKASKGAADEGFYSGFSIPSIAYLMGSQVELGAESVTIRSPVSSTSAVGIGNAGVDTRQINIDAPLTAPQFVMNPHGSATARGLLQVSKTGVIGPGGTLSVEATDADIVVENTLDVTNQTYYMRSRNPAEQFRFVTTSPSTGFSSGLIQGDTVSITMAAQGLSNTSPSVLDLNTKIRSLRASAAFATPVAEAFPVSLAVRDADDLLVEAVPNAAASMLLQSGGTLTVNAAIDTSSLLTLNGARAIVTNAPVSTTIGDIVMTTPVVTGQGRISAGSGYLKAAVKAVATSPLAATFSAGTPAAPATLTGTTGLTVTIDGVALANGDRVLVQGQADAAENGIYRVSSPAATVAPPVVAATASPLGTPTVRLASSDRVNSGLSNYAYSNGVNGVGATLTNVLLPGLAGTPDNQRHNLVLSVNGVTSFTAGDRVLIKDQDDARENGIYYFATAADVPNATRQLADADAAWDAADTTWTAATGATYANGTAGVGATLTGVPVAPATGVPLPAIDGQALAKGARVLVKGFLGGAAARNGVYQVTEPGSGTVPWVLTRVTDFDQSAQAEISNGQSVYVRGGANNGGKGFVVLGLPSFGGVSSATVGTTPIFFSAASVWKLTRATDADSLALLDQFTGVRVAASAADSAARGASNYNSRYFQTNSLGVGPIGTSSLNYTRSFTYLSAIAPGAITVDGVNVVVNDRVLVKDQANPEDNGVYTVKTVGSLTTPWILQRDATDPLATGTAYNVLSGGQATQNWNLSTGVPAGTQVGTTPVVVTQITSPATWQLQRTTDADAGSELPLGSTVNVTAGTIFANTAWTLATPGPVVLDTTKLVFNQSRKQDVFVATAKPLDGTYELVGQPANTITGNAGSLILTIDGVQFVPAANGGPTKGRVLIKDQADAAENGIYDVTTRSDVIRQLGDVRAATTAALTATYANNSPGVIASTLTGIGLVPLIDGVELVTGDRVLVQNQANAAENGVYIVTRTGGESGLNRDWVLTRAADMDAAPEFTVGAGVFVREGVTFGGTGRRLATLSPAGGVVVGTTTVAFGGVTAWQLTRSTDADAAGELPYGFYVNVTNGATNAQTGWALGTDDPVTLGTTPLDFYAANAPFVKGNGDIAITSATGNLAVNSLVSAAGDTVRLTANGAGATLGGTTRILADRAELVAGGAITANGSVTALVATSGAGITFDNSGALDLEGVQTTSGNINVSAGGRITATAVRAGGSGTTTTTPSGAFNIDLVFGAGLNTAIQSAMRSAADRWEQIIVGDVADFTDPSSGQAIDDIRVSVQAGLLGGSPSDGAGGTLANAGPVGQRPAASPGRYLPYSAQVGIDTADLTNSQIVTILTHELGHALGFTTVVNDLNLISGSSYRGPNALREYRSLLQPGATTVPLETGGGAGTAGAHWAENVFNNELMTGFIDAGVNPLSRITVGAFEDMGYTVNYAAADAYPSSASVRPATAVAGDGNISLTARAGNIDVVALTAEQDKVMLSAANGTITGLSPAAAWLDWTAKVAPEQSFYNDFQKLSANLTGAGSIIVNNPGAVTLQDVRTADGNIVVTAGGTLSPVSVVAGGKGTVYLDYSGVGGTLAAGTITSNAASPRVLRKDPVRVATTADIALSGLQSIDGAAVVAGDRVLVRSQTNTTENGIYVVAAGAWSRASDADDATDLPVGVRVAVTEGTQKGDYECVRGSSLTLGTSPLEFDRVKILEIAETTPVRLATTAPIATAALSTTTVVDGVALAFGDRVLVRRQADSAENGIYRFDGVGLVREADTFTYGALVFVTEGSQAGGYVVNFAGASVTPGTTPLRFDPLAVAVTSSTGISDGSSGADTVDITAGTVRLVARDGSIGTVTNRVDLAADVLIASATASGLASLTTGANIYAGDTGDLRIANAFASGRVDVAAGGISGKLMVDKVETDAAGLVTLTAPGDITVGTVGSADPSRRTALVTVDAATGFLRNAPDGTAVTADKVRLVSRSFASFDVAKLDGVDIFSIKQTSAGALQATFDRATPVTFDDVATSGGNIAFVNKSTGDFLIGAGGINAGAFNGVALTTGGQIGGPLVGNQGKIAGGGLVSLAADTAIAALTSAGSLAARITGTTAPGTISITETDSVQVGAAGIDAGGVGSLITLAVGGQLDGLGSTSGLVKGDAATVTARTGLGLKTELASLAASTASGVIVIRENDDLMVGATGITATSGNVSISTGESIAALSGSLFYDHSTATSGLITGSLVTLDAKKPGSIDVVVKATEIAGSTVSGSFTAVDADGVTIGRAGISAGRTVRVATTGVLAAAYANNTPGLVPATLTATGVGPLVVDGVTLAIGDRVLVKDQVSQAQNGVYSVTSAGSLTTKWRLTRAADADTTTKLPDGTVVNVSEGSQNRNKAYLIGIGGQLGTAALTTTAVATPGTDISISTVKGDILTPSTYASGEGVLAGDTVTLGAAGSATARTDTRQLTAAADKGSVTIVEKSAISLAQVWASAASGTGSVTVTAGGDITGSDVRARGTRGSVTLRTTAGDISTVAGGTVVAPDAVTLDAARRIFAKDVNGTPIQALSVNLTAQGVDDSTTNPVTPALDAEVVAKKLSASATNGSVRVVVESTDTLVLGAAASAAAPDTSLKAAGSVDISSAGGDVVVFSAPQARAGASVVRVASTANLSVSATGVTLTASAIGSINATGIDGVKTLAVGDRVLLKNQTTASQNGIYVVTTLGGSGSKWTLTRAADSDTADEYPVGSLTRVTDGTNNAGKVFKLTSGDVGATALTLVDETANLKTRINTANSTKTVSYVVSATSGTNTAGGTLGNMIDLAQSNAASPTREALLFSSTLTAPIFLTQQLPVLTKPLVIDGSLRLSPTTLDRSTSSSRVAVNGSGITIARNGSPLAANAAVDGFTINAGATIANLALGGFTRGAAVKIESGTGATVRNSSFGLTTANTKLANQTGVAISGGANAVLSGNTLGWNTGDAVTVSGGTGTSIRGNFIGTNAVGTARIGNGGVGILVTGGSTSVSIGGTNPADRNVITNNAGVGVQVLNSAFASIAGNSIYGNGTAGSNGIVISTPTVAPTAPTITNTATSKPTLSSVGANSTLAVSGTLGGSGQRFIDVYASPATSTGNQGQVYLGRITVASGTTFSGTVTFSGSLGVAAGWKITATVTSTAGGNLVTSGFSAAVAAVTGGTGTGGTGTGGTGTGGTGTGGTGTGGTGTGGVVSNPRPPSAPGPR